MQKITVLCVGKLKESFYEQAVKEYEKRLSRYCKLELLELPEQRLGDEPSEAEIRQALKKEAAMVEQKLPKGGALIAMCIEGQEMSSVALSEKMQQLAARGASQLTFLIGSSFGLDEDLKKKADLRHSLGIVLQDVNLFTGTVMDNIRYGKLDATDEECIAAAKLANAHDFITRLPDGYNTMLTANGANLSQGQRQLLSIARAAVADPPVMILDEATSSIDTRTELLVQRGMDALMKGRTVFVIAHRLSTVQNSDAIMVLDHGRIIERGTHDDLIAQKGTYYQLYTGAFELE